MNETKGRTPENARYHWFPALPRSNPAHSCFSHQSLPGSKPVGPLRDGLFFGPTLTNFDQKNMGHEAFLVPERAGFGAPEGPGKAVFKGPM